MNTAVVVNADLRVANRHAATLRQAGYVVELCAGPDHRACPLFGDLPCQLVDRADVLVYDAFVMGAPDATRQLIEDVRDTYPDLPIVLTSADPSLDWIETDGPHRVTPLPGDPTPEQLTAAVEAARADQGMAV
jgi:hypothetical protein